MSLNLAEVAKEEPKKSSIPRLPEGTYMARVLSVVDFGLQEQTDWKTGKEVEPKPTVMITFQIPSLTVDVEDENGETKKLPRYIGKEYNLSTYERSNLMKMINAIAPQVKDLNELLNVQAMVQVGSTVNDKAKITAVMACPDGMEVAELISETSYFDATHPEYDLFKVLPEWQQERIESALNWKGWPDGTMVEETPDADAKY